MTSMWVCPTQPNMHWAQITYFILSELIPKASSMEDVILDSDSFTCIFFGVARIMLATIIFPTVLPEKIIGFFITNKASCDGVDNNIGT